MRRRIFPVFLPPHDRGSLIDPPLAPAAPLDSIVARVRSAFDAALEQNTDSQLAWFGSSIGAHSADVRQALLSIANAAPVRAERAKRVEPPGLAQGERTGSVGSVGQRVTLDPVHATDALLVELAAFGVTTIEVDVASLDDDALAACGLSWRAADAEAAVARVKEAGFECGAVLRPGLPGGTEAESLRTARRVAELAPAFVRIYPVLVLSGSRLEPLFQSRRYRPLSIEEAIGTCREMVRVFDAASVPVSRLGLQPQVDVDGGPDVVAGPWHPSLRTLVEGSLWYERALKLVRETFRFQRDMTLIVAPSDETRMRGPQGANLRRLKEKFRLRSLVLRVDDSKPAGSLELEAVDPVSSEVVRRAG